MVNGKLVPKAMSNDQTPYRKDERERVRKAPYNARVCTMDQLEGIEPMHDNYDIALGEEVRRSVLHYNHECHTFYSHYLCQCFSLLFFVYSA